MRHRKTVRVLSGIFCAAAVFAAGNAAAQFSPVASPSNPYIAAQIPPAAIAAQNAAVQAAQQPRPQIASYPNPYEPSYRQGAPQPAKAVYYFAPGATEPVLKPASVVNTSASLATATSADGTAVSPLAEAAADAPDAAAIAPPAPAPGMLGTIVEHSSSSASAVAIPSSGAGNSSAVPTVSVSPNAGRPKDETIYLFPPTQPDPGAAPEETSIARPATQKIASATPLTPPQLPRTAQPAVKSVYYYAPGSSTPILRPAPQAIASGAVPTGAIGASVVDYNAQIAPRPVLIHVASAADNAPLLAQQEPRAPVYMDLGTRRGFEVGAQASYYRYRESSLDVTELGGMAGFIGSGTYTWGGTYFAGIDGRYAFGGLDYRGSGTLSDRGTDLWEIRGTIGKDFNYEYFTLSAFTGMAWRELSNDNRGTSSTGAQGYRRDNQLLYMPIGLHPRFHVSEQARISTTIEYDAGLLGIQTSHLGDAGAGNPDVINRQTMGASGVRMEAMYETPWWAVGPFFNYWDIGQSKTQAFQSNNAGTCSGFSLSAPCSLFATEPRNHTTEIGVQFRFHFQ